MSVRDGRMGWGPDESLTPEDLEDLIEGTGVAPEGLEFLSEPECYRLLDSVSVGRVGVSVAGVAIILPVNFAMVGDDVVFFTGSGEKLRAAAANKIMTFEADSFDPERQSGWSVLVVGTAEEIGRDELHGRQAMELRPAAPGERHHVVRIRTDMVSGRRFHPGSP